MLNTPCGKETPFALALDLKFMDDPWDTQSTRSLCPGTTPTPKPTVKYTLPCGSDDFQAVLQEMYAEIEREKNAKAKTGKNAKRGPGGKTISRIPTRINLQTANRVNVSKRKIKTEQEEDTRK